MKDKKIAVKSKAQVLDEEEFLSIQSATALLRGLGWSVKLRKKEVIWHSFFTKSLMEFLYNDEKMEEFSSFDRGFLMIE
ncbi:hypothetical protein GGR08_000555 [Bartonella fuyuanensis]|uniref:Uncharacterized protein n=1 Tax=Bartonella fuyuanensis TaxID=1460968 RepID=A0A840DXK8_9HYPH|nr:hypothetical protein [Bartonella fuyuanensis]MBB4076262.1 hypothetical protein [Bartonella fuyuanensis]